MSNRTLRREEVVVFYFDVIGTTGQLLSNSPRALQRLWQFQRQSRNEFAFSNGSTVITIADNICARMKMSEPGMPESAVKYAEEVMRQARANGFCNYFGAMTRGIHKFDLTDRCFSSTEDTTEIRSRHIDVISEPYMRAVIAEYWSADLARNNRLPAPEPCIWIGTDVISDQDLEAYASVHGGVSLVGRPFDLCQYPRSDGRMWQFSESTFCPIDLSV